MNTVHKTVLLNETIDGLNLKPGAVVLDATFGGGGHSREMCLRYPGIKIIALDMDKGAFLKGKIEEGCDITLVNTNFRNLDLALKDTKVDGIIFDLGLSSDQLENSGRGFSFMKDEPLLMTMKENPSSEDLTARDIVNTWGEESLADIIYGYGEERYSRRIAKAIVERREKKEIETTKELVSIIEGAVPGLYRRGRLHFATKTFQALRIAVNDELGAIEEGLEKGLQALKQGGRMSVISFHSLEDRIVKKFTREMETEGKGRVVNKKPILAGEDEIKQNPRSRSAKLRVFEKI